MKTVIVHDSNYGNGKKLAETLVEVLKEHGEVQVGHSKELDFKAIAAEPPQLLILGGAVRKFFMGKAQKKWFELLAKEMREQNTSIPYIATFITHARGKDPISKYAARYREFIRQHAGDGKVYDDWLSGQVVSMEGPFKEGVLEDGKEFAKNLIAWMKE